MGGEREEGNGVCKRGAVSQGLDAGRGWEVVRMFVFLGGARTQNGWRGTEVTR